MDSSTIARFWQFVRKADGCWLWVGSQSGGYGTFRLDGKMRKAYRIAWELTNGPIPDGLFACHRCDNPLCVNPAHLFLGTAADNNRDRHAKGRSRGLFVNGSEHPRAKLTDGDVRTMRTLHADGQLPREIAVRFGVSRAQVAKIVTGKAWNHVR